MAAPTQCTVSGTFRDSGGNTLSGVVVTFSTTTPFIHPTDNSIITNYQVSATSASDGTWSVAVVETATPAITLKASVQIPITSNGPNIIKDYYVTIPNSASTTFSSLISGQ